MGMIFLPLIDPSDFDAFQRTLNNALPRQATLMFGARRCAEVLERLYRRYCDSFVLLRLAIPQLLPRVVHVRPNLLGLYPVTRH